MSRAVLELRGISAGYGSTTVVRDVELTISAGEVVALLGPNGAGKTTLLRVAAGLLRPKQGTVWIAGADATRRPPHARARAGLCMVPEGRGVFPALTVRENLRLQIPPWSDDADPEPALAAFPVLGHRLRQSAGSLSGGEQQMLALARCWLAQPTSVLLDEVSMGLAPRAVDEIYAALGQLAARGVALLIVEQYVDRALALADRVHLLDRGRTALDLPTDAIDRDALVRSYLDGAHAVGTVGSPATGHAPPGSAQDTATPV